MHEPGWLTFYTAAREIEKQFGGSQAEARRTLRQACADQKINSMKAPHEDAGQLPFEFWTRVAPGEWREREVDFDGPDADGCKIEVMIYEADFRYWLAQRGPADLKQPGGGGRSSRKRDLAKQAITACWPDGIPDNFPSPNIEKRVGDWLMQQGLPEVGRDTILRAAGRKQ